MIAEKLILLDNAELVKRIEDSTSSIYSCVHKIEKGNMVINKIHWHRYKKN